ncbi:uncharacterized protein LOC107869011 [Capsicum annuum]|uniref:uncharacterized protein LOC107869011 n=1 Tax=Capsicum annuum TaxID=4072 RepID=UPI0007BF1FBD|nr:uncharacterized protein LOC107869011 [Capsicum annuum]
MAPFEALYRRRCRSPIGWFEVGKAVVSGPDAVFEAMEKYKLIQERLKIAQSLHKSYADVRKRALVFEVNDLVYLNISLVKRVEIFAIHPVFHVSMFKKHIGDSVVVDPSENFNVQDSLLYDKFLVEILDY